MRLLFRMPTMAVSAVKITTAYGCLQMSQVQELAMRLAMMPAPVP